MVAHLRCSERSSIPNLTITASGAERQALLSRTWAVLLSIIKLLLRRLAENTILPGTNREEELEYDVHPQASILKATNKPVPSLAGLRAAAAMMGYNTLLSAMFGSLNLLSLTCWPAEQKRSVESYSKAWTSYLEQPTCHSRLLVKTILWR